MIKISTLSTPAKHVHSTHNLKFFPCLSDGLENSRLGAHVVSVAEEENTLAGTLGLGAGLDPLAHTGAVIHGPNETSGAVFDVGTVVLAHDGLDGLGSLIGIVKGDAADVVVQDVGLDDAVEEMSADEAHLAINGGSSAADKVPLIVGVVRKGRIGVLEESDGNYTGLVLILEIFEFRILTYQASG